MEAILKYEFMPSAMAAAAPPLARGTVLIDEKGGLWLPNDIGGHSPVAPAPAAGLPPFNTWSPATAPNVLEALQEIYHPRNANHQVYRPTGTASSSGAVITVGSTKGLQLGMRPMILSGTGVFNNVAPNTTLVTDIADNGTDFTVSVAPSTPLVGATIWASTIPVQQLGAAHGEAAGGAGSWEGVSNLLNGNVVLNQISSTNVGLFDPVALQYKRGPRNLTGATSSSSTLGPDGKVYFGNQSAQPLARYDPATNVLTANVGVSWSTGFCGGVVQVPDGRLVGSPVTQTNVDIFNIYTNTKISIAHGVSLGAGTGFWSSCTVGVDGRVYMAPWGANCPRVGIFDPVTNTFTLGASCVADAAVNARYEGAVVMRSGNILMVPNKATRCGIYNPFTDTWRDGPAHGINVATYGAFSGGTPLADGRILMFPRSQGHYGIYDESDDSFLLGPLANGAQAGPLTNFCVGGVMTPSGMTVSAGASGQVQLLNTGRLPAAVAAMCTHPLYNKQ